MTAATTALVLVRLDRAAVQVHLARLSEWLLPGAFYGVQHTWPQLYRSDGEGTFFALVQDGELAGHCAFRTVAVHRDECSWRVALLGSVAVAPSARGQGHASRLLQAAVRTCRDEGADAAVLWAERPELYARVGFRDGPPDVCGVLALRPHPDASGVRRAEIRDHATLHRLHEQKPWRVERSAADMSGLLTTPGMDVFVRERAGVITAYACCGKGADLQGHWHEVGGDDGEIAALLQGAMASLGQRQSFVLLPPYRPALPQSLGTALVDAIEIRGPMVCALTEAGERTAWIDGLDSV